MTREKLKEKERSFDDRKPEVTKRPAKREGPSDLEKAVSVPRRGAPEEIGRKRVGVERI